MDLQRPCTPRPLRRAQPQQSRVAAPLRELGDAHVTLGEPAAAMPVLERSLAIIEREVGPETAEAARTLRSLGVARGTTGETGSAVELLDRARSTFERVFGPSHSEVDATRSALDRFAMIGNEGRRAKKPRLE